MRSDGAPRTVLGPIAQRARRTGWRSLPAAPSERKKVDRQTRTLFAVTDDVIRQHLAGKKNIGIYRLLIDETCWLLAADFDKKTWQEDSLAFLATCHAAQSSRLIWNGHGLEMGATFGSSSK